MLTRDGEPDRALGYCTLCAMAISQGEVPEAAGKHLPRYQLVRCTLIGRLAIAKDQQGRRLGSILLADALLRAFDGASTVGSSMVVVDALDEPAASFYAAHGFVQLADSLHLFCQCVRLAQEFSGDDCAFARETAGNANSRRWWRLGKHTYPM